MKRDTTIERPTARNRERPRSGADSERTGADAESGAVSASENTLIVRGSSDRVSNYEITVSEWIKPAVPVGNGTDLDDAARSVEDAVDGNDRRYVFSGSITDLRIDGAAVALVNGEPISAR